MVVLAVVGNGHTRHSIVGRRGVVDAALVSLCPEREWLTTKNIKTASLLCLTFTMAANLFTLVLAAITQ
jgi:hypothetical protein